MNILCFFVGHNWEEYVREKNHVPYYAIINHYRHCKRCNEWEKITGHYGGTWWESIPEVEDIYNLKKV